MEEISQEQSISENKRTYKSTRSTVFTIFGYVITANIAALVLSSDMVLVEILGINIPNINIIVGGILYFVIGWIVIGMGVKKVLETSIIAPSNFLKISIFVGLIPITFLLFRFIFVIPLAIVDPGSILNLGFLMILLIMLIPGIFNIIMIYAWFRILAKSYKESLIGEPVLGNKESYKDVFKDILRNRLTKRIIAVLIIFVVFIAGVMILQTLDNMKRQTEYWVGVYEFSEFASSDIGSNQTLAYTLNIFKEGNDLKATLNIDGWQTLTSIKADTDVRAGAILIIFDEYGPENIRETFKKGDLLFTLSRIGNKVKWGKLKPSFLNTDVTYFKKIVIDETSNWKTYRNDEFGFELKYPKFYDEYEIEDCSPRVKNDEVRIGPLFISRQNISTPLIEYYDKVIEDIKEENKNNPEGFTVFTEISSESDMFISGQPAKKLEIMSCGANCKSPVYYYVRNGDWMYTLVSDGRGLYTCGTNTLPGKEVEKLIPGFKFIEIEKEESYTGDWKLYTDKPWGDNFLGYSVPGVLMEIKLPPYLKGDEGVFSILNKDTKEPTGAELEFGVDISGGDMAKEADRVITEYQNMELGSTAQVRYYEDILKVDDINIKNGCVGPQLYTEGINGYRRPTIVYQTYCIVGKETGRITVIVEMKIDSDNKEDLDVYKPLYDEIISTIRFK